MFALVSVYFEELDEPFAQGIIIRMVHHRLTLAWAREGHRNNVTFPRPRERQAVMDHPDYYPLRERLIEFLEVHAHKRKPKPAASPNAIIARDTKSVSVGLLAGVAALVGRN